MIKNLLKNLLSEKKRISIRNKLNQVIAPIYYGNRYYCNCCEKKFSKFLAKGTIKRVNAKCPYCGSLERTRLLLEYLKFETNLFRQKMKVLHFAPEQCLFKIFENLNLEYIDADINPNYARNVVDITDIEYEDNFFDLIICSHVLAHIKDENKALKELNRILKMGSKLLVLTLIDDDFMTTIESDTIISKENVLNKNMESPVFRVHGKNFIDKLSSFGFDVNAIDYRSRFTKEELDRQKFGDGKREIIFECCKN